MPPPSAGETDHFVESREILARELGADQRSVLTQTGGRVHGYKLMSHERRKQAIKDRFEASNVSGRHVLVIDDVFTSGATGRRSTGASGCRRRVGDRARLRRYPRPSLTRTAPRYSRPSLDLPGSVSARRSDSSDLAYARNDFWATTSNGSSTSSSPSPQC